MARSGEERDVARDGRHETEAERADRNFSELLQEPSPGHQRLPDRASAAGTPASTGVAAGRAAGRRTH